MIDSDIEKKKKKLIEDTEDDESDNDETDDEGDPNFIKFDGAKTSQDKKDLVLKKLEEEIKNVDNSLKNQAAKIFPKNEELRNLDEEVGGTEINYEEVDKKNDEDKDLWDKIEVVKGESTFESSQNESFIHNTKMGGKKGKKRRKLGKMILADQALDSLNYGDKIKMLRKLKVDRGHEGGGGGIGM